MTKRRTGDMKQETSNVEFGLEFGDMNASKFYEHPDAFREKSQKKKSSK
jgi:hypothetical protein